MKKIYFEHVNKNYLNFNNDNVDSILSGLFRFDQESRTIEKRQSRLKPQTKTVDDGKRRARATLSIHRHSLRSFRSPVQQRRRPQPQHFIAVGGEWVAVGGGRRAFASPWPKAGVRRRLVFGPGDFRGSTVVAAAAVHGC